MSSRAQGYYEGERSLPAPRVALGRTRRWALLAALLATIGCALTGWEHLRFRAARQRGDATWYGGWAGAWKGAETFVPEPGTRNIPLELAGPRASGRDAGSTLELPFRADGGYRVRVKLQQFENHDSDPPRLAVSLDGGEPAFVQTTAGEGRALETIDVGTPAFYAARPPGRTRCGRNRLRIAAVSGSWIALSRVEVFLEPRVPPAAWRRSAPIAAALWLLVATLGLIAGAKARASLPRAALRGGLRVTLARLALALAALAIAAAAAELAVRWLEPRSVKVRNLLYSARDPVEPVREESFLGWLQGHRCAPAACSPGDDGFHLDRHGFHTPEYAVGKPPGVSRLLGIGDSFMFEGGPVPYRDQFFVRLGEALRVASPARRWEPINLGRSCIGIPTEVAILSREGLRLDPDVVLWTLYLGNDISDEQEGAPLLPAELAASTSRRPGAARGPVSAAAWLSGRSLYLRLASRVLLLAREAPGQLLPPCDSPPAAVAPAGRGCGELDPAAAQPYDPNAKTTTDESYDRYALDRVNTMYRVDGRPRIEPAIRLLLARMAAARARVEGRRLLIAVIPDELQVAPAERQRVLAAHPELATVPLDFEGPHEGVVLGLREQGYAVLDLTPAFRVATSRGQRLYQPNDGHLSVAGNHLTADLLFAELRARGWS